MVFQVRVGSEDLKRCKGTISRITRNIRYNQTHPGLCWQKVKDVIDDITNHRGVGMVILAMNSIGNSTEIIMLMLIMTHLSRGYKKMKSISKMIKADEIRFKVNGTTDITLELRLCKQNDRMMKV